MKPHEISYVYTSGVAQAKSSPPSLLGSGVGEGTDRWWV